MIKDVSDLSVYKDSLHLLPELYLLTKKLPRSELDLSNQVKRAAKSIAANIAEGFAKRASEKEFKRFLKISLASSDEVVTHLRTIAVVQPYLLDDAKELAQKYKVLSRRINKLCSIWKSNGVF